MIRYSSTMKGLCGQHFRVLCHCVRTFSAESFSSVSQKAQEKVRDEGARSVVRDVEMKPLHKPVMAQEVVDILHPEPGQRYLDVTFGGGGHTKALLEREPNLDMFAVDRDPDAFRVAVEMSNQHSNITPLLGKFSDLASLLGQHRVEDSSFDGVLFDVGASSLQFDSHTRGFGVSKDAPLDMRMDQNRIPGQPTAADVLNNIEEDKLSEIIRVYGQESMAKEIARAVVEHRQHAGNLLRTGQLADTVASAVKGSYRKNKLMRNAHVATRTFQALRIYVNNELNELYSGLERVHRFLKPGGLCVVIVFHSLEERVVKRIFSNRTGRDKDRESYLSVQGELRDVCNDGNNPRGVRDLGKTVEKWKSLSKVALGASEEEMYKNPRSRSARIRAAVKL